MIVSITGGTGFIGRKLVLRHLAQGDSVRVLTRRNNVDGAPELPSAAQLCRGDLLRGNDVLSAFVEGADVLYHCAAEIRDEPRMLAVNVVGTHNLIQAASGKIGRWVQLGSIGVHGNQPGGVVTEESLLNPGNAYERSKAESDRLVMEAGNGRAFAYSILRPSNVFGLGMANQSLFQWIAMVNRGLFFFVGKSGASANYIHVDNVVEALVRCATLPQAQGRIYNLSDHSSVEQFVTTLAAALGQAPPRLRLPQPLAKGLSNTFGRLPGFPLTPSRVNALNNRTVYPITRIQHELGYAHVISMEDGIRQLVAAYQQRK